MRIFVTGATGFIGRHLCQELLRRGDDVIALVRSSAKDALLPAGAQVFRGDLGSLADPGAVLPECEVVIHLAGVVAAGRSLDYELVNFQGVRDLVTCLERQVWKPRRLLFASSLAAAGPTPDAEPLTEERAPAPVDDYGIAKARAEALLRSAPFSTTSFRPPMVFGPGDPATLTLFRAAQAGLGFRVAGAPQRLSFVDVRDLVAAIALMADDDRTGSYLYFASHPRATSVPELWVELGRAVGRRVRVVPIPRAALYSAMRLSSAGARVLGYKNQLDEKQYRQMVAPAFVCSSAALRRELAFCPRHELADTLAHAVQGYRKLRLLAG
jgi:nucleoside-diphosphate-sugar epimerase